MFNDDKYLEYLTAKYGNVYKNCKPKSKKTSTTTAVIKPLRKKMQLDSTNVFEESSVIKKKKSIRSMG